MPLSSRPPTPFELPLAPLSRWLWLVVLAKGVLHLATSARGYGFFSDEFYYLACAAHPAFGYVDHPPLSIWILGAWTAVFGDSLASLRGLASLLGAAAVGVAGSLARELGGRAAAQLLTAVVVALAPVNLVVHGFYSMNAIDVLFWLGAFVLLAQALRTGDARRWLSLGALLGFGLLNKISLLWFGAGLAVGLLITPHRRVLLTPGPWGAAVLAGMLFLPHVLWQIAHDWPTAEFVRNATAHKMRAVPPGELFAQQILVWNPLALPLWLAGAVALARRQGADPGRVLLAIFVVTAGILIANGTSRPNYLALAMPPLVAAGAIALERWASRHERRWPMPAAIGAVAGVGLVIAPLGVPILEPARLVAFQQALGLSAPQMEHAKIGALDQHFADMVGWEAIVASVAAVYHALPEDERARAAILAGRYSEAGAVDRLGRDHGLPRAISPHNSYWHWGTGGADGSVVVIVGGPRAQWAPYWEEVDAAGEWDCGYCLPGRNHQTVWVARHPRLSMERIWQSLRRFE